jgi:MFS transporter, CP family, cyanate transporter
MTSNHVVELSSPPYRVLAPTRSSRVGRHRAPRGAQAMKPGSRLAMSLGVMIAVPLLALNLRPAVTSVGAMLTEIRAGTGMSAVLASAVVAAPVWCFAVGGGLAWAMRARVGTSRTVSLALITLTVALATRVLAGPYVLLAGTVVACLAIAVLGTLLPVITHAAPARAWALLTGCYVAAMGGGSGIGALVTPQVAGHGSWQLGVSGWALLAAAAWAVWRVASRRFVEPPARAKKHPGPRSLTPASTAWSLTIHFGLTSGFTFSIMGWLPSILLDYSHVDPVHVEWMFTVAMALGVPVALLVPKWARAASGQSGQSALTVVLAVPSIVATVGLLMYPAWSPWLWSVGMGLGMPAVGLALALISMRAAPDGDTAAALSSMVQGIGYAIAGATALACGLLHSSTSTWDWPLLALLIVLCGQVMSGMHAGLPVVVRTRARSAEPLAILAPRPQLDGRARPPGRPARPNPLTGPPMRYPAPLPARPPANGFVTDGSSMGSRLEDMAAPAIGLAGPASGMAVPANGRGGPTDSIAAPANAMGRAMPAPRQLPPAAGASRPPAPHPAGPAVAGPAGPGVAGPGVVAPAGPAVAGPPGREMAGSALPAAGPAGPGVAGSAGRGVAGLAGPGVAGSAGPGVAGSALPAAGSAGPGVAGLAGRGVADPARPAVGRSRPAVANPTPSRQVMPPPARPSASGRHGPVAPVVPLVPGPSGRRAAPPRHPATADGSRRTVPLAGESVTESLTPTTDPIKPNPALANDSTTDVVLPKRRVGPSLADDSRTDVVVPKAHGPRSTVIGDLGADVVASNSRVGSSGLAGDSGTDVVVPKGRVASPGLAGDSGTDVVVPKARVASPGLADDSRTDVVVPRRPVESSGLADDSGTEVVVPGRRAEPSGSEGDAGTEVVLPTPRVESSSLADESGTEVVGRTPSSGSGSEVVAPTRRVEPSGMVDDSGTEVVMPKPRTEQPGSVDDSGTEVVVPEPRAESPSLAEDAKVESSSLVEDSGTEVVVPERASRPDDSATEVPESSVVEESATEVPEQSGSADDAGVEDAASVADDSGTNVMVPEPRAAEPTPAEDSAADQPDAHIPEPRPVEAPAGGPRDETPQRPARQPMEPTSGGWPIQLELALVLESPEVEAAGEAEAQPNATTQPDPDQFREPTTYIPYPRRPSS